MSICFGLGDPYDETETMYDTAFSFFYYYFPDIPKFPGIRVEYHMDMAHWSDRTGYGCAVLITYTLQRKTREGTGLYVYHFRIRFWGAAVGRIIIKKG